MAKLKFTVALLILLSLLVSISTDTATASSDEVKWSKVNIPTEGKADKWLLADGSDVQHPAMAIDGTLYAYGQGLTYTLYQSADNGYSWSYIGNVQDDIVDIATAPQDADTIYYATTSDVYRSIDGGQKFYQLPPNPGGAGSNNIEITSIDVTHLYSNIIAVSTRDTDSSEFGGVYILDEEEITPSWTDSSPGNYDVYAVAFSPDFTANRQLVAVVTDETDTLVISKVGNADWGATIGNSRLDKDDSGIPTSVAVTTSAAIVFPSDYDITSADCAHFIAINTDSGDGDVYRINAVEAPASSTAIDLNIGSRYGLSNVDVTGLSATGSDTAINLLAGAADSAQTYYSADGGSNWTRNRKEPTGESKTYVLMAPDFSSSGQAYTATSGSESAFSISQDDGVTWNQIGLIDTDISNITDLAPSPGYSQDNTLFLLTFGSEHSLWRSTDSGIIWERIFSGILADVGDIDLVKLSPNTIIINK
ncbi:WD40/YVTN/BNR-like repeat-containing protein [Chloroflexota bacterium]